LYLLVSHNFALNSLNMKERNIHVRYQKAFKALTATYTYTILIILHCVSIQMYHSS